MNEEVHTPLECLGSCEDRYLAFFKEMFNPASQVLDFLHKRFNLDAFGHKPGVGPSVDLSHNIRQSDCTREVDFLLF